MIAEHKSDLWQSKFDFRRFVLYSNTAAKFLVALSFKLLLIY